MKRACVLSFSEHGAQLAERVIEALPEWDVKAYAPSGNLKTLTAELFPACDAMVFIGACGIAVRAIAPYVVSKVSDPAVLVIDERGKHVISLLSGHIGGANALTLQLAEAIGAEPVITTATDVNSLFSVDAWAASHNCRIDSMRKAKHFSAAILQRSLPLVSDFPIAGKLPGGLIQAESGELGVYIGVRKNEPFTETLQLIPRIVCLGIGCKRDTPAEKLRQTVKRVLESDGIDPASVNAIASIDVKQNEPGLLQWARELGIEPEFYSAARLNAVPGNFKPSEFVLRTVGTDNVCERAALCAAGDDSQILIHKTAVDGVTVAAAVKKWSVEFE